MSKKEWLNPELKNLELNDTNETLCFCTDEAAMATEAVVFKGGKPNRPGHGHNPPGHGNGGHCPDHPTPNPDPDEDPS